MVYQAEKNVLDDKMKNEYQVDLYDFIIHKLSPLNVSLYGCSFRVCFCRKQYIKAKTLAFTFFFLICCQQP